MGRSQLKRKPVVLYQKLERVLERRLELAEGHYEKGGQDRETTVYRILEAPIERMRARGKLSPIEHAALVKYRHHWYHGGLLSSCGSMDLGRIFASDPLSMSGMAKSEAQAHHRQQCRQARLELEKAVPPYRAEPKINPEHYGHKMGIVLDNVVCQECELHVAGHTIGYNSSYRAREAASMMLRDAGYRLARLWGIG